VAPLDFGRMATGTDLSPGTGEPRREHGRRRRRRGPIRRLRRLLRRRPRRGFEELGERYPFGPSSRPSPGRRHGGRSSSRRRWAVAVGIFLLLGLAVAVADAYYTSARAVADLDDVAATLSAAKANLLKGRLPRNDPFGRAESAVAGIRGSIDGALPTFGLVGALPFLGRPVIAARELVEATEAEVRAAVGARDLLEDLLGEAALRGGGGPGRDGDRERCEDLTGEAKRRCKEERDRARAEQEQGRESGAGEQTPIFSEGRFDLARLRGFVPRLEAIVADLGAAEAAVQDVPTAPFIDRIQELKSDILGEVADARRIGENALAGMRFLPELLGEDGERRYLVAFGDLSYLRGAGGSTLAIAVMSVEDGRVDLSPATQVFRFFDDQVDYDVPVPEGDWYLEELPLTRRLGNANWSPHFPSSASVMADLYELVARRKGIDDRPLDGVIQVDAPALGMMLRATGPIEVAPWPEPIDSRTVAEVAYLESHLELPGNVRREFAAALVVEAWERIGSPRDAEALLTSMIQLGKGLATKHVQVWFADREEQGLADRLGWAGGIRSDRGDYLYVVEDNLETDALDLFARQSVEHDVTIRPNGSLEVVSTVRLSVDLPAGDEYRVPPISSPRGTTKVTMVNLYVPEGASLSDVIYDDDRGEGSFAACPPGARGGGSASNCYREHVERGRRVYTGVLSTPPDRPTTLIFRYTVPDGLVRIDGGPAYRLTVQSQPKMNPDALRLLVHLPEGWSIRGDPHRFGLSEDGRTATLERPVETDFTTQLLLAGR
jgi:hypothetical protein